MLYNLKHHTARNREFKVIVFLMRGNRCPLYWVLNRTLARIIETFLGKYVFASNKEKKDKTIMNDSNKYI